MTTQNTNKIIAESLLTVKETEWVGNTMHDTMDKCLRAINFDSNNSGWYNPKPIRVPRLTGFYMLNEDGSLYYDARVIKEDEDKFRIEYMSNSAYNKFENKYRELINS